MTAAIATVVLLAGCGERIDPQPAAGQVYHLPPIEWRVVDRAELERVYRDAGMPLNQGDRLHGFAGRLPDGRMVIYTLPPTRVDDAATLTLGHEVAHVALGSYHR
ncbi:hypothetical protein DCD74_02525 [Lysobacter oculi]|uniref:Uncharacterized protein n=2 Tax=Solilutibacter oculi TaxID=2698682 RepID=A0A344J3V8_9GAMM|nr:hypothetical protein DCD74_02525 [Lysobacter oculi]